MAEQETKKRKLHSLAEQKKHVIPVVPLISSLKTVDVFNVIFSPFIEIYSPI